MLEWWKKELAWLTYLVLFLFGLGWPIWPLIDLFGPCLAYFVLGWPIWSLVDLSGFWSLVDLFGPWLIYLVLEWLSDPWIRFRAGGIVSCFVSALVSSQGLSFYWDEDLISIWTSAVMVWLYSFKSGLSVCVFVVSLMLWHIWQLFRLVVLLLGLVMSWILLNRLWLSLWLYLFRSLLTW